jgi:3-hydroxymyristoyl/3-hydroxydecanoyl-(acyl carrier protein) dehydratase
VTDFGPTSPSASVMDIDATFLPVGQMRQISRVTKLAEAVIDAEVDLGPYHWVFPQHFPGDPIFPGTLMIEAAGQLVALWAWAQGQRGRPRLVRTGAEFHSPVGPTESHLLLRAEVRRKRHLHFATIQIWAAETRVATVEAVLAVLPTA